MKWTSLILQISINEKIPLGKLKGRHRVGEDNSNTHQRLVSGIYNELIKLPRINKKRIESNLKKGKWATQ